MKDFYLAGYDVSGIQNFIFNSPVLKEIIGASHIVYSVLDGTLPRVIEDYAKVHNLKVRVKWKEENGEPKDFLMLEDDELAAEVIYVGGGNAYVAYRIKEIGIEITKIFSKTVYEETESLFIAVGFVHVSPDDDLREVFGKHLPRVLNQNKASMLRTKPLLNIAITRQDISTGNPVIMKKNDEYLTRERDLKLTVYDKNKDKIFKELLPDKTTTSYGFIREFDDLVYEKGEDSFIGVVHIDGNNMGDTIHKIMNESKLSMNDYIKRIRKISNDITQAYIKAFKTMTNRLAEYLEKTKKTDKNMLPLRPIIVNGDDITFVCQARLALSLVEIFLKEISKYTLNDKYPLSACAGIFYCRSHYPFHFAYELSEQACRNAKNKAKSHAKRYNCEVKSWIDFAISYQGMTNSLKEVRDRTYNLPELSEVVMFKTEDSNYKGYNLLNRPYLVTNTSENKIYELNFFKDLMYYLTKSEKKWPNSKLKELRNAFLVSSVLVEKLLRENKARGRKIYEGKYKLPESVVLSGFYDDPIYTPFFDVIEMLDLYEDMGV